MCPVYWSQTQKKDTLILIKILIKSFNHPSVYTEKPKVSYYNFFF